MQAIVQDHYGSTEQLRLAEVPDPVAGPGEVLVRVGAAGVDRGTWHVMTGRPLAARLALGLRTPKDRTLGRDVAGTVEALGEGVTGYAVGDAVYGTARGSFAELAVVPLTRLARRPANLSVEEAAAVPVSALTALQALRAGGVEAGDRVLVIGASGGVGSYAVQLAVDLGAHVTGVCGPAKADLVRSLGAERVVDHTTTPLESLGERFDVVLDIAGHRPVRVLRRLLTERGRLVVVGSEHRGSLARRAAALDRRGPAVTVRAPAAGDARGVRGRFRPGRPHRGRRTGWDAPGARAQLPVAAGRSRHRPRRRWSGSRQGRRHRRCLTPHPPP